MRKQNSHYLRRGAAAGFVMVVIPVLLGFAALTIDIGRMYTTRCELQRAADAAVMAGATAYVSQAGLTQDKATLTTLARDRCQRLSRANPTLKAATLLAAGDIALGTHDFENWKAPLTSSLGRWNAVEATVRRTPGGLNGGVEFFFARIFGIVQGSVQARARAAIDDRFAGYDLKKNTLVFLPFTISERLYDQMVVSGPDSYSYTANAPTASPDDIPEVRLFPWKFNEEAGMDGEDGGGNFGTLNVGVGSQGTSYLGSQIRYGIPDADLQKEFGTTELMFYDDNGMPLTYTSTGNPGLSTGMASDVRTRVGDVVAFFVHSTFVMSGSNCTYTITGIRFGRVMYVDLNGAIKKRIISIQPVPYADGAVIVDPDAPSTNGRVGKVLLVQ